MDYGLNQYTRQNIYKEMELTPIKITNGVPGGGRYDPYADVTADVEIRETNGDAPGELPFLLSAEDEVRIDVSYAGELNAPVEKGARAGVIVYKVNGEPVKEYEVVFTKSVGKKDWVYIGKYILQEYLRPFFYL